MWLRVLTGDDAGRLARVRGERFVVGRREDCDLVLRDPSVARRHAAFEQTPDGGYALSDLGSDAGTFVATRRLREPTELRGDEELCFGETFAQLSPKAPRARRRTSVAIVGAGVLLFAGAMALLALRVGGSEESAAPPDVTEIVTVTAHEGPGTASEPATTGSAEVASAEPETTEESAGTGAPVAFSDDFSDPSTGWEVFSDPQATAGYEDGEYVMRILDATYYAIADSGRNVESPIVRVTARNPALTTNAGFGVICRYRGADDYYVLAIGANGSSAILRRAKNELRVLTGGGAWLHSPRIPVGASRYEILADCRGDRLSLSVNGKRIASAPARSPAGRVGLFAAGPAEIHFDNFVAEPTA